MSNYVVFRGILIYNNTNRIEFIGGINLLTAKKYNVLFARIITILILSFFIAIKQNHMAAASDNLSTKKVLFISSYSESYDIVPEQIKGIEEVLLPHGISLDIEYMDTKRLDTADNITLFFNLLKYKLSHMDAYDAVIVGDDNALQFAINYQYTLFHCLPIIFLGVNDINRAKAAGENPYITGIIEETSLKDNIKLALSFNPGARRVVAFVDNTYTGIADQQQFYNNKKYFPNLDFEIVNSFDNTFDELKSKIEAYGSDTILLYLNMYVDKNGTYFSVAQTSRLFREHSKAPVYRTMDGGIGKGVFGGKVVSFREAGKMAAGMVLKTFNGTPVKDIAVVTKSPNYYILDYSLFKKYGLNPALAPKGTIFVNKRMSFYEQNKQVVWTVLLIILSLSIFILLLVMDNIKRRAIETALTESRDNLAQKNTELAAKEEELRSQYIKTSEHSEKMNLLNERFELATSSTSSAVWEIDFTTNQIYFSENIRSIVAQEVHEYENVDDFFDRILTEDTKAFLYEEYDRYLLQETSELNVQLSLNTPDHSVKWVMVCGKGVHNEQGEIKLLHGILLDITKMKAQEIYIEHLAHYDFLTDLPNRICFMDRLKTEMSLEKPLAIIMLDIDNFKEINDTLGHVYGDLLLKDIADRLSTLSNNRMFISRFGGDEFLILFSEENDRNNIEKSLHEIQILFKKPFQIGLREHFIRFSMGISRFPNDSTNMHQLIMDADTAMYHVKHNGKNNYQFYNKSMQKTLKEHASIETILRRALKENGFYLLYQPIVNVMNGEIKGFEALLRLEKYKVPPNLFIPIAEESDIILDIGRYVTKEAIAQIANWREKGFSPKTISINFSSKQIRDYHYIDFLKTTLEEYHVEAKYLMIEITESVLLDESSETINFLYKLRDLGLSIVMDDFGTGYSSINYLTYIPVDHIKLDKSLSDNFLKLNNTRVINSIISLAHSLNLTITAEGIEERNQYEQLKEGGCDFIQGYYFSKPLEIEKANEIYDKKLITDHKESDPE
jgi:diguanylate cyclase (GGDEF) domain